MMEEMETEVLPDQELPDDNAYLVEDEYLSGEEEDMPETGGNDDGETVNDITDTGSDKTEDDLPEDETGVNGTDIPVESLNVTGNILILPEGYELDLKEFGLDGNMGAETGADEDAAFFSEQLGQISEQLEQVIETVSIQNNVLYGGTAVICLMLGAVLGVLLIHGFRLRRI